MQQRVFRASKNPFTGISAKRGQTSLRGYEIIWGMDFLPDGDPISGEKRGKLYRKTNESVTEISGFPIFLSIGQGGLPDIRVHPEYSTNGWIYASYSAANPVSGGQLRLIRFKIDNYQVGNIEKLFSTNGSNTWYGHYGSRIVFDGEGYLCLSVWEGGSSSYGGPSSGNNNAQNLTSDWGKIHRLSDGRIPDDNPVFSLTPSIGICGMALITSNSFGSWKGKKCRTGS